jgi:hypothetical protein
MTDKTICTVDLLDSAFFPGVEKLQVLAQTKNGGFQVIYEIDIDSLIFSHPRLYNPLCKIVVSGHDDQSIDAPLP